MTQIKKEPELEKVEASTPKPPAAPREVTIEPGSSFVANGRTYFVMDNFSIGRFDKIEDLEHELLQFSDKRTCHQVMVSAMKKINECSPGDAYMQLYNKVDSDQRNAKIIHYTLRLCTAYINTEDEDIRYLPDELIKRKIDDWSAEGLSARPFLVFAASACRGLLEYYSRPMQNILQDARTISELIAEALDIRTLIGSPNSGQVQPLT